MGFCYFFELFFFWRFDCCLAQILLNVFIRCKWEIRVSCFFCNFVHWITCKRHHDKCWICETAVRKSNWGIGLRTRESIVSFRKLSEGLQLAYKIAKENSLSMLVYLYRYCLFIWSLYVSSRIIDCAKNIFE